MKIVKPKKLVKGDLIGLISPASPVKNREIIDDAVNYIEKQGYKVILGDHVYSEKGYFAGDDQQRLDDLHKMFSHKDVKAIFCLRGGYGAGRLLDKIDYNLVKKHPKIFSGFSDITALSMAFLAKTGMVTFAGPMPAGSLNNSITPFTEENFWRVLTSDKKIGTVKNPNDETFYVLKKGKAEGNIIGGNLCLLSSLMGTSYLPKFNDSILLMEEVGEAPYRIDRMFNQLRLAGIFNDTKGIILGRFINCIEPDVTKKTLTINDVIGDYFENIEKPVLYNFIHGHVPETITIPFGLNCTLNSSKYSVSINESGVC